VKDFLAAFGLEATKIQIQDIADEDEFKRKRREVGQHRA
jgi:hypothetical protein